MNLGLITKGANIVRFANRLALKTKYARPEIFMFAGIIGIVGGTILACKRTLLLDEIMDNAEEDIDRIQAMDALNPENTNSDYTADMAKKDLITVYTRTVFQIAKLYALPIVISAAGIISIVGGNRILRKEYVAISGAFASLTEAFKKYRKRVIAEHGPEKDRMYRFGTTYKEIEVVDKKGRLKKEKIEVLDIGVEDLYTTYFREGNPNWTGHAALDIGYLNTQFQYLTDKLVAREYLTLAEVYEALGERDKIKKYPESLYVGWVWGAEGDDYVSGGLDGFKDADGVDILTTFDGSIALEFNVNGHVEQLLNAKKMRERLMDPNS